MRENSRVRRQRTGTALGAGQTTVLLVGAVAMLGGAFVLGVTVGRRASTAAPAAPVATQATLDRLDDPLAAREEPAPELKAPQALTDARPIEKAMPLAPAKLVPASAPTAAAPAASAGVASGSGATAPTAAAAAKPPSKPAAHAPPDHHPAYAIQVASSPIRADAERIAAKLAGKNPRIVTADVPGKGRVYRVQVGAFPSHDAAAKHIPQLARAGVRGIVVTAQR